MDGVESANGNGDGKLGIAGLDDGMGAPAEAVAAEVTANTTNRLAANGIDFGLTRLRIKPR